MPHELSDLFLSTDKILCQMYHDPQNIRGTKLRFPNYQNSSKNIRVSEQEARFALAHQIENSNYIYSIETPTIKKHRFVDDIGTNTRSAMIDMQINCSNHNDFFPLNIEFKKGGFSVKRQNNMSQKKDIVKLLSENHNGCFYHLLESTDCCTIRKSWDAIITWMRNHVNQLNESQKKKKFIYHVCVLERKYFAEIAIDGIGNYSHDENEYPNPDNPEYISSPVTIGKWTIGKII